MERPEERSEADDARSELGAIARSLGAYLEWQADTGAIGIPRGRRTPSAGATGATPPAPATHDAPHSATVPVTAPPHAHRARDTSADDAHDATPTYDAVDDDAHATPTHAHAPPPVPTAAAAPARATPNESAPPPLDPALRDVRLPVLEAEVAGCVKCGLAATRNKTVFARGNAAASLCFIGEAPGADEDAQGLPFVGRAGQLLDRMIGAMGLSPERDVYVCNIIKCRPPENRKPTPEETATCIPYLHEQIALVRPKVIVALGNTAVAGLLGTKLGITKLRGEWKLYRGSILVMPTYHPSYLIRPSAQQAEAKRQAWDDLQKVMKELKIPLPARPK